MTTSRQPKESIRVKVTTGSIDNCLRQFPDGVPEWGNCSFVFEPDAKDYDWFVVVNDVPGFYAQGETLCCHKNNTLLVTIEPSNIKSYGKDFTNQFGHVLTSQSSWALPHRSRIFSQPALFWFYGSGENKFRQFNEMRDRPPLDKHKTISTVCSSKRQTHTLHHRRFEFTQEMKKRIPELEIYGHGVRPMDDKAESLDDYRYHLAIENFIGEHHWTEKLSDAFLGATLPFYVGCPNAVEYFPEQSFIALDIDDVEGSAQIIRNAIENGEYEKRIEHILEARRLVLEEYSFFAVISRLIESRHLSCEASDVNGVILSRRQLRREQPFVAVRHLWEKVRLRFLHAFYR